MRTPRAGAAAHWNGMAEWNACGRVFPYVLIDVSPEEDVMGRREGRTETALQLLSLRSRARIAACQVKHRLGTRSLIRESNQFDFNPIRLDRTKRIIAETKAEAAYAPNIRKSR